VTLNAGTLIPVRLVDGLSSERNLPGDAFTATLDKELVVNGFVIAERGARVEGRVVASDRGGRVKGVSALEVELIRLHTADGQKVPIQTMASSGAPKNRALRTPPRSEPALQSVRWSAPSRAAAKAQPSAPEWAAARERAR
jgi:hypothetical protein